MTNPAFEPAVLLGFVDGGIDVVAERLEGEEQGVGGADFACATPTQDEKQEQRQQYCFAHGRVWYRNWIGARD